MDISSILSDGPPPEKKEAPDIQKDGELGQLLLSTANGPSPAPSGYNTQLQQQTPVHPLPSADGARSTRSVSLTPVRTPSQGPMAHSFSHQPSHSPAQAAGSQYRPYDGYPPNTTAGRPPSHGSQYSHPSPQTQTAGIPHGVPRHQETASHSPTPSSHPGQTPHSVRQSPAPVMNQGPPPGSLNQPQYHHSQPSTPLGPPPLHYQRSSSTQQDMQSPYHLRRLSTASSGIVSGSPAQPHPNVGNLVGSPTVYNRPSPQIRRTSEYLSQVDRERSLSVSPKTKVPPRPQSLSSRHSSSQDTYSALSSMQPRVAPSPSSHGHLTYPQQSNVAQPPALQHGHPFPNPASVVSHATLPVASLPNSSAAAPDSTEPNYTSAQALNPSQHQLPLIQHHSQKMGMNHLLAPTREVSPIIASSAHTSFAATQQVNMPTTPKQVPVYNVAESSSKLDRPASVTTVREERRSDSVPDSRQSLKRSAESASLTEPPAKQQRMRKYSSRPLWAQYSRYNPRHQHQQGEPDIMRTTNQPVRPQQLNGGQMRKQLDVTLPQQQSNGTQSIDTFSADERRPWRNNPPLDFDLIHTQRILGSWEKTFRWNTPLPDMQKVVQDWLFVQLEQLRDVGITEQEGKIEIEAKIGTLLQAGVDDRCALPVASATVINAGANRNYRFESQMTQNQHKAMNDWLNVEVQNSHDKGRVKMAYHHLHETDSFRALSAAGHRALPQSIQRRNPKHQQPKLRTTVRHVRHPDKTNPPPPSVTARIVKLNIDNLHIFNPLYSFDCRISINLEVNFMHSDIDPEELTEPPTEAKPTQPDRVKDRVSYQHLAYSIDLTKVEVHGLAPKYELEVEVDTKVLREQHQLMSQGKPNAFGDLVCGFLDNATFLMRHSGGR